MTAKDILYQSKETQKAIDSLERVRTQYEILADAIPSKPFDEPVVDKTRSTEAPFIRWMDKIMFVETQIKLLKEHQIRINRLIIEAVEALKETDFKAVIIARCLSYLTWEEVCSSLFISMTTAKRWHHLALEEIEKMDRSGLIWTGVDRCSLVPDSDSV